MRNKKFHLYSVSYLIFSGIVPSLFIYFIILRFLSALEENQLLVQLATILTALSPIIGPILGSFIYFKFVKYIPNNLWKYTLVYSMIVVALFELYFIKFEPLWSGFGLILGFCNGTTLAIIAFLKSKNNYEKVGVKKRYD